MTSGLPPEADFGTDFVTAGGHVSKVPTAEVVASFDHLVGGVREPVTFRRPYRLMQTWGKL